VNRTGKQERPPVSPCWQMRPISGPALVTFLTLIDPLAASSHAYMLSRLKGLCVTYRRDFGLYD
jgi:hypothetical protein